MVYCNTGNNTEDRTLKDESALLHFKVFSLSNTLLQSSERQLLIYMTGVRVVRAVRLVRVVRVVRVVRSRVTSGSHAADHGRSAAAAPCAVTMPSS